MQSRSVKQVFAKRSTVLRPGLAKFLSGWVGLLTAEFVLANRNDPICVVPPKVAKASTVVAFACCCR
jgi:hypothetical protein